MPVKGIDSLALIKYHNYILIIRTRKNSFGKESVTRTFYRFGMSGIAGGSESDFLFFIQAVSANHSIFLYPKELHFNRDISIIFYIKHISFGFNNTQKEDMCLYVKRKGSGSKEISGKTGEFQ